MIAIRKNEAIDIRDVIDRSPAANIPGAEEMLRDCMYRSVETRMGFVDGEVACMWGLIPPTILSDTAWLWLITTNLSDRHKFLLIRYSQRYIEEALKEYPNIIGDTAIYNRPAQRWLKWLGAEFGEPNGSRLPFVIRAKNV